MRQNRPREGEAHRLHVPAVSRSRESPQAEEGAEEQEGGELEGGEAGAAAAQLPARPQVLQLAHDQSELRC